MNDQVLLSATLIALLGLFIWGKVRYDALAIGALFVLVVLEIIPANDAFAGFAHPAVIPTKPPKAPFNVIPTFGFPEIIEVDIALIEAAHPESKVVTAIEAKSTFTAANADPTLNPNQPNQSIKTPSAPATIELPLIFKGFPFSSYL